MGSKYEIRTDEIRIFPLKTENYTEYRTNSVFEFIKLYICKHKHLIYIRKNFY